VGVRLRLLAPRDRGWKAPSWAIVAVAATSAVAIIVPSTPMQVAVLVVACVVAFGLMMRRRAAGRAEAAAVRADIACALRSATAELRAGVEATAAIRAAVADGSDVWAPVRAARAADMRTALESAARSAGADNLVDVAAAWHLAEHSGAPLAVVLDRLADSIQAEVDLDREVSVEAGPARATGRLMAVLPVFGLGLGMLLGVNPVQVLVGTPLGVVCLATGLALACGGVWWIERIVCSVDDR
jgi:tight adherence protein B